jgi:hypothetical protein
MDDPRLAPILRELGLEPDQAFIGLMRALAMERVFSQSLFAMGYLPRLRLVGLIFNRSPQLLYLYPHSEPKEWLRLKFAYSRGGFVNRDFKPGHEDYLVVAAPEHEVPLPRAQDPDHPRSQRGGSHAHARSGRHRSVGRPHGRHQPDPDRRR